MSKLHLPLTRNPVANAQSSTFVDDDLARTPTINDELAQFMAFAIIPDALIPEFLVFEDNINNRGLIAKQLGSDVNTITESGKEEVVIQMTS